MGDAAAPGPRYGARVYVHADGVFLVKQTVKRGTAQNDPYVVDQHHEEFVDPSGDQDRDLGRAVRKACEGRL